METTNLKGFIRVEKISPNGEIEVREAENTVCNLGKAQLAGLLLTDIGGTAFDYLALGTSNAAPNATQSALIAEVYRTTGAGTRFQTSVANDTAKLSSSFSITSSVTLQEMGILNSASSGVLLARATYSSVACSSGDTVNAVYNIQVT